MSKTNFKCMFLIDDKLYNKAILREESNDNTKVSIPNSTYLTPIPSSLQLTTVKPADNMTSPVGFNLPAKFTEINDLAKADNGQQVKIDMSDKDQQTEIPFVSASSPNITTLEKSENNDGMEIDESKNEKEDCECYNTLPKASSSRKRQATDVKTKLERKKKRLTKQAKRKLSNENDNLSDDSDWEELKHRYRKLRGDFDSPPRDKNNFDQVSEGEKAKNDIRPNKTSTSTRLVKKKDGLIKKFESITYACTTCKQIFRKRTALHEHIMKQHSEYFKEQNKKKRSNEYNYNDERIRSDGKKKRNMPQNQSRQKIARREFSCVFCQRFFKTTSALERHTKSIHGDNRGSKRVNGGNDARYVKRQKVSDEPAVTYLNYF